MADNEDPLALLGLLFAGLFPKNEPAEKAAPAEPITTSVLKNTAGSEAEEQTKWVN